MLAAAVAVAMACICVVCMRRAAALGLAPAGVFCCQARLQMGVVGMQAGRQDWHRCHLRVPVCECGCIGPFDVLA